MKKTTLLACACLLVFVCGRRTEQARDITTRSIISTQDTIPLKITHISPIGSVEGLRESFRILVGFNQAMVPLQAVPREETSGPLDFNPPVNGKYRWYGSRTLAFAPYDTLAPAMTYQVTLKAEAIQSLTGMRLKRDTSWTFESVRPNLLYSQPRHRARFIDRDANIYLYFNMPMAPHRVNDKISLEAMHGMPSPACGRIKPLESRFAEHIRYRTRNLRDSEKEKRPLKDWDNARTLVLTPVRQLPIESEITVQLKPGLLAATGDLGLSLDKQLKFRIYNVFRLIAHSTEIPGGDPLDLCFSNDVKVSEVVKHMTIDPHVDIPEEYEKRDWSSTGMSFYFPFELNSTYCVTIDDRLVDVFDNKLDKDYEFTFHVGDYLPYASIPTGINIVESKSDLRFPAIFRNVDKVPLAIGLVDIANAIPFLNTPRLFSRNNPYVPVTPGFFKVNRDWHVNTYEKYPNQRIRLPIELHEVLGSKKQGFVFVQFKHGDYKKAFVEVTDLGITWKYAPENNLVWITSLHDTRAVANARVQFRDNDNRVLWQGHTDKRGLCELPGWATRLQMRERTYEYEDEYELYDYTTRREPKFWLLVTKDSDHAILSNTWRFGVSAWRFNIPYNWNVRAEEYGGCIFTEKGLYRSGETVHIKGIVRKKKQGEWVLPDVSSVNFVVRNSRNEEIVHDTLRLNKYGSFFFDVPLSEDAPTGVYAIQAILPDKDVRFSQRFRVEAYRPVEFEVIVEAEKDTFVAGETFRGSITGRYLFGMPMIDAPVSWSLRRRDYHVHYPQHKGYRFGEYKRSKREVIGSGSGKLDKQGIYAVSVRLTKDNIEVPSLITLEATVTAPNKRTVSKAQNWIAFHANVLVGLKRTQYVYVLGDTVNIHMITIEPSGEKTDAERVSIEIVKEEWKSIKKARHGGRYEWVSERTEREIEKRTVTSSIDSTTIPIVPKEPGYYYVRAYARDSRGHASSTRTYFYVAGQGYAGWRMRDDDIIELVADKDEYEVGDTARILVKSPYDSALCLVTVERELILRKHAKMLKGNADFLEIPIESIDLPNIYVCATLIRGRVEGLSWDEENEQDLGKPQFKMGYVNLRINTKEKHLTVTTWSDKANYRPRDSVTLALKVNDHKGRPVANSDVALFAVDVGVLNIIDFQTPDPFDYFYGSRPLSVKTIESRLHILGERSYGEKGEERGGGGLEGEGIKYREKFIATAFHKADVRTDKNGMSVIRFELPDNLTKFRIMAVAQTRTSEFGSAESTFAVNLPLILTPSIPRFVRVGDEFRAGLVIHNRTDNKENSRIDCRVQGLKMHDEASRQLILEPQSSEEVLFSFSAEQTGNAVFMFNATMGTEKDALKLTMPVALPPFIEAIATFSSTTDSSLEGIIVPSNIHEDIGGLEIDLSSSILAGMQRGIEHLLDYPYGCLEQRLSRILPLIVGEKIINQFNLAPFTGAALRYTVQMVLDEVPEYQLSDGGFVYFKNGIIPCPYLSAYTMYVLYRAKTNGYAVDTAVVRRGKAYLQGVLRWKDVDWTYPYNVNAQLTTKSFCLYSLALWGEYEKSYATQLFERREQIPLFGKALLMRSGRLLKMGTQFRNELARILLNKVKLSPTTAHFEESENRGYTFPAPAKVTGYVLTTFIDLGIAYPYLDQTIRWLVQERTKKTKPTTHENAFVFDAFQTYYEKYEKEEPDFVARVLLGEKEIIKQTFKGRTNEPPQQYSFALTTIPQDTLVPIRISKVGDGRLYYVLRMLYAFKQNPVPFDEGFYIWKEILTLDDKPVRIYKRGEVYKVVLHVVVPETRLFAVLDDPLAAGFVPVQTYFATESQELRRQYRTAKRGERGHWWGSFDHEEYYDDRVFIFGHHLFPGEHTWVYFIRAATPGTFLAPSTKIEEMYSPEVFGSTTQGYITIK